MFYIGADKVVMLGSPYTTTASQAAVNQEAKAKAATAIPKQSGQPLSTKQQIQAKIKQNIHHTTSTPTTTPTQNRDAAAKQAKAILNNNSAQKGNISIHSLSLFFYL